MIREKERIEKQKSDWFDSFAQSAARRRELEIKLNLKANWLDDTVKGIGSYFKIEEKERYLMRCQPVAYSQYLRDTDRQDLLTKLYDGTITHNNYTWYLILELLPKISKMRAEGKLTPGKRALTNHFHLYRSYKEPLKD